MKKKDEAVLDTAPEIADARIKMDHIHWYVPQYTPSSPQNGILSKQILSKTPTELRYIERCFYEESPKSEFMEFQIE